MLSAGGQADYGTGQTMVIGVLSTVAVIDLEVKSILDEDILFYITEQVFCLYGSLLLLVFVFFHVVHVAQSYFFLYPTPTPTI